MIPAFELHRPEDVSEASDVLERLGDAAAVVAGGTELLLVMKLGFADYAHLVDVKRIAALGGIVERDGTLVIGGAVTHRAVERSPLVRSGWAALARMTSGLANPRVRGTGTWGGNLCFADPHSDLATFLLAADARVVLQRARSAPRRLGIDEFLLWSYETALDPTELLVAVEVPPVDAGVALAHERFTVHERPAATVTVHLAVEGGAVGRVRLSVGSVGGTPVRLAAAERLLDGRQLDELGTELFASLARAAQDDVDPVDDAEGSVRYKRQLVRVLLDRAIRSALADALAA